MQAQLGRKTVVNKKEIASTKSVSGLHNLAVKSFRNGDINRAKFIFNRVRNRAVRGSNFWIRVSLDTASCYVRSAQYAAAKSILLEIQLIVPEQQEISARIAALDEYLDRKKTTGVTRRFGAKSKYR